MIKTLQDVMDRMNEIDRTADSSTYEGRGEILDKLGDLREEIRYTLKLTEEQIENESIDSAKFREW